MCNMERETKTIPAVEVWRPVKGYEGYYEVSDQGRVRSLDRTVRGANAMSDSYPINLKGCILKPGIASRGYRQVILCRDGVKKHCGVHRLVAEAFIPNPDNLPQVNHKDENTSNNIVSNLEWCDTVYNINYGTGIDRRSRKCFKCIEQLTLDGQHVAYYESTAELERLSKGRYESAAISNAARGRSSCSYGYKWRYVEKTDDMIFTTEPILPNKYEAVEQLTLYGQHVSYYPDTTAAANAVGVTRDTIRKAIKGTIKTSKGYRWRYV